MSMSWMRRAPLAAAVIAAALAAGCGTGSPSAAQVNATGTHKQPAGSPFAPRTSATATPTPGPTGPVVLPVAPGAGALPQNRVFPSTNSTAFHNAMADLWLAVTTGNPRLALPAFFPVAAYQQVKAIPYPAADWQDRLWYDFTLDVGAAHELVDDQDARLVQVIVPAYDAAWVYPGDCYNSEGYWHVGGARVVYREHGQERSIGIASLISWRGVWYVVHFGAVLRSVVTGIVDQPTVGPGIPGPAGGC
jgi:hypothetical protein